MASPRQLVWDRAGGRCEYCQLPQALTIVAHAIDHIISQQHHGGTTADNLYLACAHCNRHKGPNLSGIDPESNQLVRLFNPRVDSWTVHFRWRGATLEGLTDIGRGTIEVLAINDSDRIERRQLASQVGLFPPMDT
ncbi:MAG TPA: HNH endonuclease signature motif containing protein [Pirellulaceae bacterium]|jgi:hypothetical protein